MRTVEFEECEVTAETDLAICVEGVPADTDGVWIPKSVISDDSEIWKKGDEGTLVVAEWFAMKEGLI